MAIDETPPADGPPPVQRPGRDRHREPPVIEAKAESIDEPAAVPSPDPAEPELDRPAETPARPSFPTLPIAVSVALVLSAGAAWLAWQQQGVQPAPAQDLSSILARLDKLEAAPRPAPAATPDQLAALDRRISALEQRPAPPAASTSSPQPPPTVNLAPLEGRLAAVEKVAREAASAAETRPAPVPPPPAPTVDLSPLDRRVAALEAVQAEPKTEVRAKEDPAVQPNRGADRTALAVVTQALFDTVDRGRPFRLELTAAEALGAEDGKLAPLKPLAEKGIPTPASLSRVFSAVASKVAAAAEPVSDNQSLVDRLTSSATKLVRVRPAGEARGDDAPTLVSRIEAAFNRGDVAAAVADLDRLPPAAKTISGPVADLARQRLAAIDAARSLRDAALSALTRPKD